MFNSLFLPKKNISIIVLIVDKIIVKLSISVKYSAVETIFLSCDILLWSTEEFMKVLKA
jgi:hypothetical protein